MSAPDNAKPLGTDGWEVAGEKLTPEEALRNLPTVTCEGCGWKGHVTELVAVPDEETLWCPQCGGSCWIYD